jgi:ribosomal protein L32
MNLYECQTCGHQQRQGEMCDYCGSYDLIRITKREDDERETEG